MVSLKARTRIFLSHNNGEEEGFIRAWASGGGGVGGGSGVGASGSLASRMGGMRGERGGGLAGGVGGSAGGRGRRGRGGIASCCCGWAGVGGIHVSRNPGDVSMLAIGWLKETEMGRRGVGEREGSGLRVWVGAGGGELSGGDRSCGYK